MKTVGLIYPNSNLKGIARQFKYMPLGIMSIASVLRENGYNVKLLDANNENKNKLDILDFIQKENCDYAGFSATTTLIDSAIETIDFIKEKLKDKIKIIVGGIHATILPEEVLNSSKTDFVVMGEGENTIKELLHALDNNSDLNSVKGIAYKNGQGYPVINPPEDVLVNLDKLPLPSYDLIPLNKYSSITSNSDRFVTYIRSRGCPFNCTFCSVHAMFGKKYRVQSPEKTIKDLKELKSKYNIKEVLFKDSEFILNRDNCFELFREMTGLNLRWSCGTRVDSLDEEMLRIMKKAGCDVISYGIESGSPAVLERIKKDISLKQIKETLSLTGKFGITRAVSFIIGHYNETEKELMESYKFIKNLNYDYISVSFMTPFPGSELFEKCRHLINSYKNLDELGKISVNLTENINDDMLMKIRKKIYFISYFRIKFIFTILKRVNLRYLKKSVIFFMVLIADLAKNIFSKVFRNE